MLNDEFIVLGGLRKGLLVLKVVGDRSNLVRQMGEAVKEEVTCI